MDKKTRDLLILHALDLLKRRQQSEQELRTKLTQYARKKGIENEQVYIDQTVTFLKEKRFIDDDTFAQWYADQRITFRHRSKRVLRHELKAKGIESDKIDVLLENYDEKEAAVYMLSKKSRLSDLKKKQYLARLGFSWDVINECI